MKQKVKRIMAPAAGSRLTQAAFMRHAGISRAYFRKLRDKGLPLGADNRIDVAAAEKWIKNNTSRRGKNSDTGDNTDAGPSLTDLRRQREAQKVEAGELELAARKGELIARKVVKRFIAERARLERDAWLNWASAVSARLAATLGVDHGKLCAAIEDEVRAQLRLLAEKPLQ